MNHLLEVKKIIESILENRGKKLSCEINNNTHLRNDLGFDSLDLAELTVKIEYIFGVDVFADGIIDTVEEIIRKIEKK
ncbi:MAG: acyl carrier protein [Bacteroidales bacterium]|nr:acyl carrier protein [Bacteroidales bacterium]